MVIWLPCYGKSNMFVFENPTGNLPVDFLYSYPLVMEGGDIPSTMVSIKYRAIGTGRKEISGMASLKPSNIVL